MPNEEEIVEPQDTAEIDYITATGEVKSVDFSKINFDRSIKPEERLYNTHQAFCGRARDLMVSKNKDYSNPELTGDVLANFRSASVINVDVGKGMLIRVLDKIKRLSSFIERGDLKVDGEGWRDSVLDIINYMILLATYLQELELKGESTGPRKSEK